VDGQEAPYGRADRVRSAAADHRAVDPHFSALPLIAILRGVQPAEAVAIGHALVDAGFRVIEVSLNSLEPAARWSYRPTPIPT